MQCPLLADSQFECENSFNEHQEGIIVKMR
jgi:hypothetical protein